MKNCNIEKDSINYKRNVKIDFLYHFLGCFDISGAIWVLYMVYRGLSLWQVGIVEGVFHITSFLFEVPSGAIADLLGRKQVILAGRICAALSSLMLFRADSILDFMLAYSVAALGYNLNSGSEEALVYDSMKADGREQEYHKVNSYLEVVGQVSGAAAVFLGGVLSEYSFTWCYLAVLAIASGSMLPVLFMKEPPAAPSGEKRPGDEDKRTVEDQTEDQVKNQTESRIESRGGHYGFKEHAVACRQILRENGAVRRILLYYPAVSALWCAVYFYGQEYFARLGLNRIGISLVMLAGGGFSILGAMFSQKLTEKLGCRIRFAAGLWVGAGILLVSTGCFPAVIAGFFLGSFSAEVLYPLESAELNSRVPSAQRATIISMDSMMFSVFMIAVFPPMGFLADLLGMAQGFGIMGILMIAVVVFAGMKWSEA